MKFQIDSIVDVPEQYFLMIADTDGDNTNEEAL